MNQVNEMNEVVQVMNSVPGDTGESCETGESGESAFHLMSVKRSHTGHLAAPMDTQLTIRKIKHKSKSSQKARRQIF